MQEDILQINLSDLSVNGVVAMLGRIDELKPALTKMTTVLQESAISGRVLKHCDLNELKSVMGLSFGHWELFRLLITTLKDCEKMNRKPKIPGIGLIESTPGTENTDANLFVPNPPVRKNSATMHMEKQVNILVGIFLKRFSDFQNCVFSIKSSLKFTIMSTNR